MSRVQIPVGLLMKKQKRWSGTGSSAKVARFVSTIALRMPLSPFQSLILRTG
jgi:hypothetical protein